MLNPVASKYARALFEIAISDNKLDSFFNDLINFHNLIFINNDAKLFLLNPIISKSDKKSFLNNFCNFFNISTFNFFNLLIDKNRFSIFPDIISEFESLKNRAQGIIIADVTTAFPLSKSLESALIKKISSLTNKKIRIRKHDDKSIIGGIILSIGDLSFNYSISHHLQTLKSDLFKNHSINF